MRKSPILDELTSLEIDGDRAEALNRAAGLGIPRLDDELWVRQLELLLLRIKPSLSRRLVSAQRMLGILPRTPDSGRVRDRCNGRL